MGRRARQKRERKARRRAELPARYAEVAARIAPKHFRVDSCVNGTWVAVEVLRRFGVRATPVATRALVLNPTAWRLSHEEGWPETQTEWDRWEAEGAWLITIDEKSADKRGYCYHVVCVADHYLIDAAAGQFDREAKDILTPFVLALPAPRAELRSFLSGADNLTFEAANGAAMIYQPVPDEHGFRKCSGFRGHNGNLRVADEIEAELRKVTR